MNSGAWWVIQSIGRKELDTTEVTEHTQAQAAPCSRVT